MSGAVTKRGPRHGLCHGLSALTLAGLVALVACPAAFAATSAEAADVDGLIIDRIDWGPAPAFRPLAADGAELTLEEAVRIALQGSPTLFAAAANTAQQRALEQVADGQFDNFLVLRTSADYRQRVLRDRRLALARQRRSNFEVPAQTFDDVANSFEQSLEGNFGRRIFADCPEGSVLTITDPDGNIIERIQCPTAEQLRRAAELTRLYEVLAPFLPPEFEELLTEQIQIQRTSVENVIRALRLAIPPLRRAFLDLGPLPEEEESFRLDLQAAFARQFRTGIALSPAVSFSSFEENFVGKEFDERFGGLGVPNLYTAEFLLAASIPLGKGRGAKLVGAGLESAGLLVDSAEAAERHAAAQTVLAVVEAYWNAAAAAERVELLNLSVENQVRLFEITEGLIEGDEVPAAEISRVEARLAQLRTSVVDAEQALRRARIDLARVLGLELDRYEQAPMPSEPLPRAAQALPDGERDTGMSDLLGRRWDLESARLQRESAEVLREAARLNLKRRFDLSIVGSYSAVFEGRSFGEGLEETFLGDYAGPSLQLQIDIDFPVRNRVARGQLAQATALESSARINEREVERSVRSDAARQLSVLEQTIATARLREQTREGYEAILASDEERFRLGDGTVIDGITSESRLTSARLDELSARLDQALALARWRFATGRLLAATSAESYAFARPRLEAGE
ncbi:MAG: TolC family protein [Acidobacteria bacterium]|nr:MAG: TolC family protein [Acidobacteriota bacterium]REK03197.1 MAG: TolC family protein [Acidobacteriota bacterium]